MKEKNIPKSQTLRIGINLSNCICLGVNLEASQFQELCQFEIVSLTVEGPWTMDLPLQDTCLAQGLKVVGYNALMQIQGLLELTCS
jgi:hypothetical protein